jgi:co-chaperonin GroES (HSP10)
MATNINTIIAKEILPLKNRVIVTDMYFGEQTTDGGIIVSSDDGTTRGVYPRWAKVYAKGPENNDPYDVGDWILVEHGRWTRGMKIDVGDGEQEFRTVEAESVLLWNDEKPEDLQMGAEYGDANAPDTHRPEDFIRT